MTVPYVHPNALDAQLNYIRSGTEYLYLCSSKPTTFSQASSTYRLAYKSAPTIATPVNSGIDGGRKIVISQITDGINSVTGVANYYALTDNSASRLLFVGELEYPVGITSGEEFVLDEFAIEARPAEV